MWNKFDQCLKSFFIAAHGRPSIRSQFGSPVLRMGGVRLPPVVQSWQSLDLLSLDELHEVTSMCFRQSTSNDAFAATMRKALLADSTYTWTALRAGIGPMRACWRRYQDINMTPPARIVGALGISNRRFGATWTMTDEEKSCSCWILLDSMQDAEPPI